MTNLALTHQQIDEYHRTGFLVVEQLIDAETVRELRTAFHELVADEGRAAGDRMLGGITRQIMLPSEAHECFADNRALRAAQRIGEQLTGEAVERVFDMLIFKAAGHPYDTPWHQDMAYSASPTALAGTTIPLETLQFWVALEDVDVENGCMHFIGGQHTKPLLEHVVASGKPSDDGRLLALRSPEDQLDLNTVIAAPIAAGGCTIHSYGTPHYTPPNQSATRPRPAYIFNLAPAAYAASVNERRSELGIGGAK